MSLFNNHVSAYSKTKSMKYERYFMNGSSMMRSEDFVSVFNNTDIEPNEPVMDPNWCGRVISECSGQTTLDAIANDGRLKLWPSSEADRVFSQRDAAMRIIKRFALADFGTFDNKVKKAVKWEWTLINGVNLGARFVRLSGDALLSFSVNPSMRVIEMQLHALKGVVFEGGDMVDKLTDSTNVGSFPYFKELVDNREDLYEIWEKIKKAYMGLIFVRCNDADEYEDLLGLYTKLLEEGVLRLHSNWSRLVLLESNQWVIEGIAGVVPVVIEKTAAGYALSVSEKHIIVSSDPNIILRRVGMFKKGITARITSHLAFSANTNGLGLSSSEFHWPRRVRFQQREASPNDWKALASEANEWNVIPAERTVAFPKRSKELAAMDVSVLPLIEGGFLVSLSQFPPTDETFSFVYPAMLGIPETATTFEIIKTALYLYIDDMAKTICGRVVERLLLDDE